MADEINQEKLENLKYEIAHKGFQLTEIYMRDFEITSWRYVRK